MTLHLDLAKEYLDSILGGDSDEAALNYTRLIRRLERNEVDEDYRTVIGQSHPVSGRWSPEQYAAFLAVHAGLMSGDFAKVTIEVGDTPSADSQRDANQAKLSDLPCPFTAVVDLHQNCAASGDGSLTWSEPIKLNRSTGEGAVGDDGLMTPVLAIHVADKWPGNVQLEIGYSFPSVTLGHLCGPHKGVARAGRTAPSISR